MKIGELLLREKKISKKQLEKALEEQKGSPDRFGSILIRLGYVKEEEIAQALSKQFGYPSINISKFEIGEDVIKLVNPEIIRKHTIMPIHRIGTTLTVAMADPSNLYIHEELRFSTNLKLQAVIAPHSSIKAAIDIYYGGAGDSIEARRYMEELEEEEADVELIEDEDDEMLTEQDAEDKPAIKLVNLLFRDALKMGASDLHFEPFEKEFRVRFRIDGILHEHMTPPMKLKNKITVRLKLIAGIDIAEKRLPQDGRIKTRIKVDNRVKLIDMRVSALPTVHGEKIVIRILDKESLKLDLTHLGFERISLERFEKNILEPWGIILVTGPTGSGKTNTLYSAISKLNNEQVNIITAENPVEFNLYGISQVNVKEHIGLTFPASLRSFLRQDPDIILVGEIRDFETADIAIKAALTGHLVLSTLHTNDAPSTVARLINMGIEPFLVSSAVRLIVAQRLVRKLCVKCKAEVDIPAKTLIDVGFTPEESKKTKIFSPKGCDKCNNTGYKGRIALFEALELDEEIKEMIILGSTTSAIRKKAKVKGMLTLRGSGIEKIKQGITSVEEVVRQTTKI